MMRASVFVLSLTAFLLLCAASAVKDEWSGLAAELPDHEYRLHMDQGGDAPGAIDKPIAVEKSADPAVPESPPHRPSPSPSPMLSRLAPLYKQNTDLAGWLCIEGVGIDHPVMYTPNDEEYYIDRNFNKEPDKNGTLFIQADCDPFKPGVNIIIHGHNMKSGKMFAPLIKYKDEAFFRKHPTIRFDTLTDEGEYDIIAVFLSKVYRKSDNTFKYYKFINAEAKSEFDAFVSAIKELSLFETGVGAEFGDTFITLSTCEYSRENGRMVIVARKSQWKP